MSTPRALRLGLRAAIAAGLGYQAYVHLHLAPTYDAVRTSTLSQGDLFRVEAGAAALAALLVLLVPRALAAVPALLVAAGGLAAVVLYRYVDIPAIGPLPAMYEPVWYGEKSASAVVEGLTALLALGLAALQLERRPGRRRRGIRRRPSGAEVTPG